jgi:hypothetical protein
MSKKKKAKKDRKRAEDALISEVTRDFKAKVDAIPREKWPAIAHDFLRPEGRTYDEIASHHGVDYVVGFYIMVEYAMGMTQPRDTLRKMEKKGTELLNRLAEQNGRGS